MNKNFPWIVALFFFLVAVAALMAPEYKSQQWQPTYRFDEFIQRANKALPEPGFVLYSQREDGGSGEGYILYELYYEKRDSTALSDYSKLTADLIHRLEPQTRSGGERNYFMHADDRFVRIETLLLADQKVRISYLEVYHW